MRFTLRKSRKGEKGFYIVSKGKVGSKYFPKRHFYRKVEAQNSLEFRRAYAKSRKK